MAVSAGAIVRTSGSWLSGSQIHEMPTVSKRVQHKEANASGFGWGALDDDEIQRVRKAGQELIKFQSIGRGY